MAVGKFREKDAFFYLTASSFSIILFRLFWTVAELRGGLSEPRPSPPQKKFWLTQKIFELN